MNIKTRLWINVISSVVIGITVFLIVFISLRSQNISDRKESTSTEIVKAVAELKIVTLEYVLHAGERANKQWLQRHDSLTGLLTDGSFNEPEEKDIIEKLLQGFTYRDIEQNRQSIMTFFTLLTADEDVLLKTFIELLEDRSEQLKEQEELTEKMKMRLEQVTRESENE